MAIEKVIDIKVQGNADEAVGSLRSQLRAAQADVAELSAKFGATSQEAIQAAKRAGELKDQIGDAKALTEAFNPDAKFKALSSSLAGVAGGFAAVQGGMALFGAESKEVEKTLLKVQSAMALSQGLQQIGESVDSFKQLGAVIKSLNIVQVANNFIQTGSITLKKQDVIATAAQATATVTATAATSAATTGMKLLRLAIIGTGIGALVVGLVALYQNFDKVKEAVLNFIPGLASVGKFIGGIIDSVTDFVGATSDASRALDAMREAADKSLALNKKYLEQQGDQLDEFTKKKIDAKNRYLEALKDEGNSEKDRVELAKRLNRELAAADKEREDEKAKKRKEATDKINEQAEKEAEKTKEARKKERENYLKDAEDLEALKAKLEQNRLDKEAEVKKKADEIQQGLKDNALTPAQRLQKKYDEERAILEAAHQSTLLLDAKFYTDKKALENADTKNKKENAETQEEIEKRKQQAREQYLAAGANTLKQAASLLGEATGAGKALAIAATTIDTYQSATAAYKSLAGIPVVGPALGGIAAGVAVASGLANVKKILSVKVPGGGGGGGGNVPSGGGAPSAPQFNVVGNSGVNQLAGIMATNEQTPVKAYVVPSDVTTGQSLDRNIIRNASLG
jgi:flagellar biosynthesis protein FliQ